MATTNSKPSIEFLKNLISFRVSIDQLKEDYKELHEKLIDSYELITLTKEQINHACQMFIDEKISAKELEEWSDLVEGLDPIQYEEANADQISHTLFLLSSPDINGSLTKETVRKYQEALKNV